MNIKYVFCAIGFAMLSFVASSQSILLGDSLKISFVNSEKNIRTPTGLFAIVVYENVSNQPVSVYTKLVEGYRNDRFYNLSVDLEKKAADKFEPKTLLFYKINPDIYYSDSLRHFDLPKTLLYPHRLDTLKFNLVRKEISLDTGFYRMKINLRVQTIQDTSVYHHNPTGASIPPEDQINYITSDWIYFKVEKESGKSL